MRFQKNFLSSLIIIFLNICIILFSVPAFSANFPLEITNIKPAGTGKPAIPSTNRIFRSYPGIEYNIRAAVIGGLYPYTYSLSNAPSDMTINSRTGEINWPNPQRSSGMITLTVTDDENTTINTTWSINVGTEGFIFINGSYSGTETGSITQPYSTLSNMLNNESTTTDIVYFRAGTYILPDHASSHLHAMNISSNPTNWISYPGEAVVLQCSDDVNAAQRIVIFGPSFYFDGFTMKDFVDYGLITWSSGDYKTIRNCVFDGLVPSDSVNNNYGFIHTTSDGSGYYFTIQDSEFKNWRNASAIGSLYNDKKILIENNYIHGNIASGSPSGIGTTSGISPKYYNDYITIRGNLVVMDDGNLTGGINAAFVDAANIEICFNAFHKTSGRGGHIFDFEIGYQRDTHYYRNTLIGDLTIRGASGPYTITNNVISNPDTIFNDYSMTDFISHSGGVNLGEVATISENLTNATASKLVDEAYLLIGRQSQYVGSRGWQFADGSTPMDGAYTPPQNSPAAPKNLRVE